MVNKTKEQKTLEFLRDKFEELNYNFNQYQKKQEKESKGHNFYEGSKNGISFAIIEVEKILEERFNN